jgi:hypothetical protein
VSLFALRRSWCARPSMGPCVNLHDRGKVKMAAGFTRSSGNGCQHFGHLLPVPGQRVPYTVPYPSAHGALATLDASTEARYPPGLVHDVHAMRSCPEPIGVRFPAPPLAGPRPTVARFPFRWMRPPA